MTSIEDKLLHPIPGKRKIRLLLLGFLCFILSTTLFAQQTYIAGRVTDSATSKPLPGVNVSVNQFIGTSTDKDGAYILEVLPGDYQLTFSFIGYKIKTVSIVANSQERLNIDVLLENRSIDLETAIVTAGRYTQQLADVTVSVSVMKPAFIENINTITIDNTIDYLPGVDVLDGQASIRGGGGYSYGAGSRVSVLVDDMPLLSPAESDVKWNFIPVEDIAQVEVLKGASSALYGSSALNGVINFRTAWPNIEPKTTVTWYGGFYNKPQRDELSWWWDNLPLFSGVSFSHSQKFNTVDLVAGANGFIDQGYRTENYAEQFRMNLKFRHRPKNIEGFSYGLNTNMQWQHKSDFFIWLDADSGAFMQDPDIVNANSGIRLNVDPWLTYHDSKNNRHNLRTRYYRVTNDFKDKPENNNTSNLYYGEYQYQREFKNGLNWSAGVVGNYAQAIANLYGNHNSTTVSIYTQFDYTFFKRLSASLGLRWENHQMDDEEAESGTVVRAGLNYKAAKATYIRASYGQGYRFPSIAEKFTATNLGAVNIFPNPLLKSETGWSSEVGLRQGFQWNNWSGFIDAAFFWTEYNNMIEFTFGVYKPDTVDIPTLDHVGFKSLNVGKAQINGFEIDLTGNGKIGSVPLTLFFGYTFMNPVDLSVDSVNQILKYRYRHSVKGDIEINVKRFSTGIALIYRSFMERIDEAFEEKILGMEIFPGLKDYREENNTGAVVVDFRASYLFTSSTRVAFIFKNIFNKEYMGRPGDIQPPRNITLQVMIKF